MVDNNFRSVIPKVCANCEHKREPGNYPKRDYSCDVVVGFADVRRLITHAEVYYKTCDKFSVKVSK